MKELSIEEKAKRYDEVIKKVNDYYEGKTKLYSDVDKALDYLFPAFKDSEDEKIRKELIQRVIHDGNGRYTYNKNDYIAWLEKQSEKNPKFRIGDTIKKKSTGDIVTICEIDLKNREYRLSNTGFIPFKYEHLWELVEQNSINKIKQYIPADAFIEKAKKWFEKQNEWLDLNGNHHYDMESFEDFRKYMKGE